jgi:hypothetical protein
MNQNLSYFLSIVVGAILSYFINQLPNVPENVKPWTWILVIGLTLVSAVLMIRLSSNNNANSRKTVFKNNKLSGKRSKIRAVDADVVGNKLTGDDTEITTNDGTSGRGGNP